MNRKINTQSQTLNLLEYCLSKVDPDPDRFLNWGMAGDGAWRSSGGAFWGFKLSDLVHTLGDFVKTLSV